MTMVDKLHSNLHIPNLITEAWKVGSETYRYSDKVKVKFTLFRAMKARRGRRGTAVLFL